MRFCEWCWGTGCTLYHYWDGTRDYEVCDNCDGTGWVEGQVHVEAQS